MKPDFEIPAEVVDLLRRAVWVASHESAMDDSEADWARYCLDQYEKALGRKAHS